MAAVTGKRKRVDFTDDNESRKRAVSGSSASNGTQVKSTPPPSAADTESDHKSTAGAKLDGSADLTIQIVTGDYERVVHGLVATIPAASLVESKPDEEPSAVAFSETFLLAAHTASIRCLAISPKAENSKRFLATGSADERINIYSISTVPPQPATAKAAPTLNGSVIAENAKNRSLGSLNHHDRAITRLEFPTKGKLFSAAEDNIVAISRTRDWTMLSSVKAPIPKVHGRPSGDTAAPGELPTGVNDFAIHPSQKLMLSVSRGERSMRLWNLMTGKKAGVLNFGRDLLLQAGEGKYSSGEGRRVLWDSDGEHYLVGFERGAVLFGVDSKPRAICKPPNPTKLHQFAIVAGLRGDAAQDTLAVSTEDGRILFFDLSQPNQEAGVSPDLPRLKCIAQVEGRSAGVSSRIKDFTIVNVPSTIIATPSLIVVTAGSDGTIQIWAVRSADLKQQTDVSLSIGQLLATHKTQSRITCLDAFIMDGIEDEISSKSVEPVLQSAEPTSGEEDDSD